MVYYIETLHEEKLLEEGYGAFTQEDKDHLITILSRREGSSPQLITEEYIFEHHKHLKSEVIKEACEDAILNGFTASNGHFYRTNRDDQINMIGQKDALGMMSPDELILWKTEDAGYVTHTQEEWMKIYVEAFIYKKNQLLKYNILRQKMSMAETHEDILAINWEDDIYEETTDTTTSL